MATVGIRFEYEADRHRSLICCIVTSVVASIPVAVAAVINKYFYQDENSTLDLLSVYGSYILQYGSTLQYYVSFSIRIQKVSMRYAALNRYLR